VGEFPALLAARTVDVAIGPVPATPPSGLAALQFLRYEIVTVARPDHPLARHPLSPEQARRQCWCLGPAAAAPDGLVPEMVRRLGVPEANQQIFQSHAAALEEAKRTDSVALALQFAVAGDLAAKRLVTLEGRGLRAQGGWAALALPREHQTPATAELLRFVTTPRATQAMVRGAGVHLGRFKPAVHVTLWS
jgi:DNA-binding transcriptional LysR family regulator